MFRPRYDEQKRYWDSEHQKKRRSPDHAAVEAFARPKIRFVLEALGRRGMRMLEIGAGNGYLSRWLGEDFDLTCLDFSPTVLGMNPVAPDRKVVGDAARLPFPDGAFDVVLCANLLHHLEDPAAAVREMARVAKHHVVLLEPNAKNPLMWLFGLLKPEERGTLKFTERYLRGLAAEAGLSVRAFAAQGMVLPNKTPGAAVPVVKAIDPLYQPGFYLVAVLDKPSPRA